MPNTDPIDIELFDTLPEELKENIFNRLERNERLNNFPFHYSEVIKEVFKDETAKELQEDLMEYWLSEPNDVLIKRKQIILDKVQTKMHDESIPFLKRTQWLFLYNHLRGKKIAVPNTLIVAFKKNLTPGIRNSPRLTHCEALFSHLVPMLSQTQVDSLFTHLTQQLESKIPMVGHQAGEALLYLSRRLSSVQLEKLAALLQKSFCPWMTTPNQSSHYGIDTNYVICLLNKLAEYLPAKKFRHFQSLVLALFHKRPWDLLPSLTNLLPTLDLSTIGEFCSRMVSGALNQSSRARELRLVAEAVLKNPAFIDEKNRPPLLEAMISSIQHRGPRHFTPKQQVNFLIQVEVFLPLFPLTDLNIISQNIFSLLVAPTHIDDKRTLSRIITKIALRSPDEKIRIIRKIPTQPEQLTMGHILICAALHQEQLIDQDGLEGHLLGYLSAIEGKSPLLSELLSCALTDVYLAKALKNHLRRFFTTEHLLAIFKNRDFQVEKVRASVLVLFNAAELRTLFENIVTSIPIQEEERPCLGALKNLVSFMDKTTMKTLTEDLTRQILTVNENEPRKLIKLLSVLNILTPIAEKDFIEFLYKNINATNKRISTSNSLLRNSILETLGICFYSAELEGQKKIIVTCLHYLSEDASSSLWIPEMLHDLISTLPASEKKGMIELLQANLSIIKNKRNQFSSEDNDLARGFWLLIFNTIIFGLQKILAENGIVDKELDCDIIKSLFISSNAHIINDLFKILILMSKEECLPFLKSIFDSPMPSFDELYMLCRLAEKDKIKLKDFIIPGNVYHEFLSFYAVQYELSINQEDLLTRLSTRKVLLSEMQQLLCSRFDKVWDESQDFFNNILLLLNDYGFHQSKLLQFFSQRHHLPAAERLMIQIRNKKITSIETLYHQLAVLECTNNEGHFYTLREYIYQKMGDARSLQANDNHLVEHSNNSAESHGL